MQPRALLFLLLGILSLTVGVIGIFVPVLPTTPFLLVSAWSFLRSSKRLYEWLLNHRVLGFYVKNYFLHRGTTVRAKVTSLIVLWGTLIFSITFVAKTKLVRIILFLIGLGVTAHVLKLRTIRKDENGSERKS